MGFGGVFLVWLVRLGCRIFGSFLVVCGGSGFVLFVRSWCRFGFGLGCSRCSSFWFLICVNMAEAWILGSRLQRISGNFYDLCSYSSGRSGEG